jgi:hypothetical protein
VLRVDRVERLAAVARRLARQGAFGATPELARLAGCAPADLALVLPALGYRAVVEESGITFHAQRRHANTAKSGQVSRSRRGRHRERERADGPFAKLRELQRAR